MAYISSFTYCDSIQMEMTPQGPRNQIVNPLQVLAPIAIPGNYSFAIACNVAGFDVEKENIIFGVVKYCCHPSSIKASSVRPCFFKYFSYSSLVSK